MSEHSACLIWGTPATEHATHGRDGRLVDSPRAGGKYFISGTAEAVLRCHDDRLKVRLTTWLVEQRRLGNSCPEIIEKTVQDTKNWRDMRISDRADGVLRYLATRSEILGTKVSCSVPINLFKKSSPDHSESAKVYYEFLSHSECVGPGDLTFLLDYLEKRGLIENTKVDDISRKWDLVLTVSGYARLAELEDIYTASSRAFVAMWFDDSMNEAWEHGIELAIRKSGYEPVRIDQQEHVNRIDDEIIAEIRKARFLVADFTQGDSGARGGVYYEAGFAHGLGIPVIFSCRQDSLQNVHFDTRQYNHIVWKEPEELRERLARRITAVIGEGPNRLPD